MYRLAGASWGPFTSVADIHTGGSIEHNTLMRSANMYLKGCALVSNNNIHEYNKFKA